MEVKKTTSLEPKRVLKSGLSFRGLKFEEALSDLLKVKPQAKENQRKAVSNGRKKKKTKR